MKNQLASTLRTVAFVTALFVVPALAFAGDPSSADRAAQQLAVQGGVPVNAAGAYVEIGTYQIQVSAKLGRPAAILEDGAWLYPNFTVDGSNAKGTLVVRFRENCVSELSLVTPAVALAMSTPKKANDKILVAARK